jgi:hypothetical protein
MKLVKHGSIVVKSIKNLSYEKKILDNKSGSKYKGSSKGSFEREMEPINSMTIFPKNNLTVLRKFSRHKHMPVLAGYVLDFSKQEIEAHKKQD